MHPITRLTVAPKYVGFVLASPTLYDLLSRAWKRASNICQ